MTNRSLYFDGVNSEVIIKHKDFYNVFPFSIQCWIKTTQNNNKYCSIINKYVNGSQNGWSLNIYNGKISFWIYNNGYGCDLLGKTVVNDNEWHNIIITVSDRVKFYVDGILDTETSSNISSPNTNSTDIALGLYQGYSAKFEGFLDDFSFWNVEMDDVMIAKCSKGLRIEKNNEYLNGYWNMDDIVDNQIIDYIKKNNGIIKNVELASDGRPIGYYKYLIKQDSKYYSLASSLHELGQPINNEELEKWYNDEGVDNLNILCTNKELLPQIKETIGSKFQIAKWEEK